MEAHQQAMRRIEYDIEKLLELNAQPPISYIESKFAQLQTLTEAIGITQLSLKIEWIRRMETLKRRYEVLQSGSGLIERQLFELQFTIQSMMATSRPKIEEIHEKMMQFREVLAKMSLDSKMFTKWNTVAGVLYSEYQLLAKKSSTIDGEAVLKALVAAIERLSDTSQVASTPSPTPVVQTEEQKSNDDDTTLPPPPPPTAVVQTTEQQVPIESAIESSSVKEDDETSPLSLEESVEVTPAVQNDQLQLHQHQQHAWFDWGAPQWTMEEVVQNREAASPPPLPAPAPPTRASPNEPSDGCEIDWTALPQIDQSLPPPNIDDIRLCRRPTNGRLCGQRSNNNGHPRRMANQSRAFNGGRFNRYNNRARSQGYDERAIRQPQQQMPAQPRPRMVVSDMGIDWTTPFGQ